jgi:hypothetical protein
MRPLVLAVALFAAVLAHAAPTLEFHVERSTIATLRGDAVFVHNTSAETAYDLVVRLEYSAGLRLYNGLWSSDWTCSESAQSATCRIAEFAPDAFDGLIFIFDATDDSGGHGSATATLSARDLGTVGAVTIDVIAPHKKSVTTTDDYGAGSLREAIDELNDNPICGTDVPCNVSFAIAGQRPFTIAPASPLPAIRKCNVFIDGPEDVEFPTPEHDVAISGENASYGNGLEVRAACAGGVDGVTIDQIAVHSWPWNGVYFAAPAAHGSGLGRHYLRSVYVGTDVTGLVAKPNGSRGIVIDSPYEDVVIAGGLASGNARSGIAVLGARLARIMAMGIGVDRHGNPMGNGASGVFSFGAPFVLDSSVIENNAHFGVSIAYGTPLAMVTNNRIAHNAGLPIDWGLDDRTPSDDESDGVLNAPRVVDAFYDETRDVTVIRGTVRLRAGAYAGGYTIEAYLASSQRGDVLEALYLPPQQVAPPATGVAEVELEIAVPNDLRGKLIALQTHAGDTQSSEISEALPVR